MTKKRIYELAKELDVESKHIIKKLEGMGIKVKSPSSSIDDDVAERLAKTIKKPRIKSGAETNVETKEEPLLPKTREIKGEGGETTSEVRVTKGVIRRRVTQEPAKPLQEKAPKKPEAGPETEEKKIVASKQQPERSADVEKVAKTEPVAAAEPKIKEAKLLAEERKTEDGSKPPTGAVEKLAPQQTPPKQPTLATKPDFPIKPAVDESPTETAPSKKRVEVIEDKKPSLKKVLSTKFFGKKGGKIKYSVKEGTERPAGKRRKGKKTVIKPEAQKTQLTTPKQIKRRVKIGEAINVGKLAKRMGVKATEVIAKLLSMGMMLTLNQSIDKDVAMLVADEFGYQVDAAEGEFEEMMAPARVSDDEKLKPRAPVVTVMGHVDHGKTSLLDSIRKTNVMAGEAGGITQAIGAHHVRINERDIVFLDTPGHEAFTAMRARGAKVTDIVVLVVAADDGVRETTIEAINHARAADVPIVVAVNKIDKPEADIDKVRRELSDLNLMPEDWGGQTIFCQISAKKDVGIEDLLEMILLQADILELKANPEGEARGIIIEAKVDKGRGPVATVLIQEGTIKEGDSFVSKAEYGRVRALVSDNGKRIKSAGPAMPVEVIGFSNVPQIGSEFACMKDDKKACSIAEYWTRKEREKALSASSKITLEQLYQRMQEGAKELNIIVKGDVQGSVEAIKDALGKLDSSDIKLKMIHSSTGAVTETDVILASAANAVIIGFNVAVPVKAAEAAQKEAVEIKSYDVIYNVINDIKAAMLGLLEPTYKEVFLGKAEVRQVFKISKVGTIAGCYVTDGKIIRNCGVRILREGEKVFEGKLQSLKRVKDDVKEVALGYECGLAVENFGDIRDSDIIEAFTQEKVKRESL